MKYEILKGFNYPHPTHNGEEIRVNKTEEEDPVSLMCSDKILKHLVTRGVIVPAKDHPARLHAVSSAPESTKKRRT